MAHKGAEEILRPISRKYDLNEHAYPVELDTISSLFEGISAAKTISFAGTDAFRDSDGGPKGNVNGGNMSALVNSLEIAWGYRPAAVDPTAGPGQRRHLRGGHR